MSAETLGRHEPPPGTRIASRIRWALVALAAIAATFSVLSWIGSFRTPGAPAASGGGDSMPGMPGMKMETSSSATAAVAGSAAVPGLAPVDLDEVRMQNMGVAVAAVERTTLSEPVRGIATVTADESRVVRVQSRFSGWIDALPVSQTGVKVSKGQVLAQVFSKEVLTAAQEYRNARGWSGGGSAELAAQSRTRLQLLGLSDEDIAAIERADTLPHDVAIRAPIDGYVTAKGIAAGAAIDPGTLLFEITDLSRVWAWAEVYERDLPQVHVGQTATLSVAGRPDRTFDGRVTFLSPTIDPQTRTLRVRVELANPSLELKPGMYADAVLAAAPREALTIPRDALIDTGERRYVFVQVAPGRFSPRAVRTGAIAGGRVEVLDGLTEGESVVTGGNFLLDSESRLRASTSSAAPRADIPIDRAKYPDKYQAWIQCEQVHRGMGSMEEDCKNAIPKPWR